MSRQSFFFKNYVAHFLLIVMAFTLVGSLFYRQLAQYSLAEKQAELQTTVESLADQTQIVMENESEDLKRIFALSLSRVAQEDQIAILIASRDGTIVTAALQNGTVTDSPGWVLMPSVVSHLRQNGGYAAVGSLGIFSKASNYAVGMPCYNDANELIGMVFVSTEDETIASVSRHLMQTFVLITLITLIVALLISFLISRLMTRPLNTIAAASKEFAGGNFSVRVPEENHCLEIDELAVSFNNMARDLESLDELTRGFIGNVSHEFKTPMTTIGGFVDGMVDGTIPPEQHEKYLRIIAEETHRLSRMVTRMLDAAKIQSGELLLSPAPFDFSEMTSQIILSFEQKIEKRQIQVDCDLADRLTVMGDRDHIFRAVYNLVDNAVKFTVTGGELTLRAKAEGGYCVFAIRNTGTEIAPEELPRVFDRFYKADRSRSLDKTGAGLGLYIVKNIINLHGGEISVRSGNGATEFELTLPLAPQNNNSPKTSV